MNRIILIGNGFDLAHGMKTSYQNFMDYFWESHFTNVRDKQNLFVIPKGHAYKCEDFEMNYYTYAPNQYVFKTYKDLKEARNVKVIFKNLFFRGDK